MNWGLEDIIVGKYKVKSILKPGQSGNSFKVEHIGWDLPFKLKIIAKSLYNQDTQKDLLEAFFQRWIALKGCSFIANIYYIEEIEGHICLLLEYVNHPSLAEHEIKQWSEVLDIAIQVARALEIAALNRLAHNNLKKNNVFIDGNGMVKLHDFLSPGNFDPHQNFQNYLGFLYEISCGIVPEPLSGKPSEVVSNSITWKIPSDFDELITNWTTTPSWFEVIGELKKLYEKDQGKLYGDLLESSRVEVEFLNKQALTFLEKGYRSKASELWSEAMNDKPASISACWNRHLLHFRVGIETLEQLLEEIEGIQEQDKQRITLAKTKLLLETGVLIEEALEEVQGIRTDPPTPAQLRAEGELFYRLRNFEKAIKSYEEILNRPDCEGDDYYGLAACYFEANKREKAIETWLEGSNKYPNHVLLQIGKAVSHFWKQELDQTQKHLESITEKWPESRSAALHAAEFFAGRGIYQREVESAQTQRAVTYFEQVLKVDRSLMRALRGYRQCGGSSIPSGESRKDFSGWSQIKELVGHQNLLTVLATTKKGDIAISGDCDGEVFLWDLEQNNCLAQLKGHSKHISDLVINKNGTRAASTSWDKEVRLWEVPSGKSLQMFSGHEDKISSVDIDEKGERVISGSWDGTTRVWSGDTGECIATKKMDGWVTDVALFSSGEIAVSCDEKENMEIWEVTTGKTIATVFGYTLTISSDESIIISSSSESIDVWDASSTKQLQSIPTSVRETCLGITQDNLFLLTKNNDDILKIWYLPAETCIAMLHNEDAIYGNIIGDGKTIVSANGPLLHIWENVVERTFPLLNNSVYLQPAPPFPHTPELIQQNLRRAEIAASEKKYDQMREYYRSLQMIPGYETVSQITRGLIKNAKQAGYIRGSLANVRLIKKLFSHWPVTSIAAGLSANLVVTSSADLPLQLWNMQSKYMISECKEHSRVITQVAMSNDGKWALAGGWDQKLYLWDLDILAVDVLPETYDASITALALSEDGKSAFVADRKGIITFWNLLEKSCTKSIKTEQRIIHLASGKEHFIVSWDDGTIGIYNHLSQEKIAKFRPHGRMTTAIDISKDDTLIASSSRNGKIILSKLDTLDTLMELSCEEEVTNVHIVAGNRFLISGGVDGYVRFWELSTQKCIHAYQAHTERVVAMSVSEERFVVTSGEDGSILLSELDWAWQKP